MTDKRITTKARLDGDGRGELEAVVSTFHVVDKQGDVVLPSAFTDGQAVPLVWHHAWDKPIGDGRIRVERDRAVFRGRLWLDTDDGEQAYRKIKNAGALQEFSWGFEITDAEPGVRDGRPVRVIKRTRVYECSPVLVGAGEGTRTLAIKAGTAGSGHRTDPALAAIRERLRRDEKVAEAEAGLVLARVGERVARERRLRAEAKANILSALATADRALAGYRGRG